MDVEIELLETELSQSVLNKEDIFCYQRFGYMKQNLATCNVHQCDIVMEIAVGLN